MLSQNIQQKSLDLPDLAQDRDVILLILDQFLCKFVQVGINQPDGNAGAGHGDDGDRRRNVQVYAGERDHGCRASGEGGQSVI